MLLSDCSGLLVLVVASNYILFQLNHSSFKEKLSLINSALLGEQFWDHDKPEKKQKPHYREYILRVLPCTYTHYWTMHQKERYSKRKVLFSLDFKFPLYRSICKDRIVTSATEGHTAQVSNTEGEGKGADLLCGSWPAPPTAAGLSRVLQAAAGRVPTDATLERQQGGVLRCRLKILWSCMQTVRNSAFVQLACTSFRSKGNLKKILRLKFIISEKTKRM